MSVKINLSMKIHIKSRKINFLNNEYVYKINIYTYM